MKYGFSFKGTHTNEIPNLTIRTASRPIMPETRDAKFTVPFMDGAISTAVNNPYKREFYEERVFTMTMTLTAANPGTLNKRLAKISSWLTGRGKLIFDDTPLIEWDAFAYGTVDYAPERSGTKAVLSVSFCVSPFGSLVWSVTDGPMIGQKGIYLCNALPLDINTQSYETVIEEGDSEGVLMLINNYGDRYVRPVVKLKATGDDDKATVGAVTVSVLDGAEMTVAAGLEVKTAVIDCAAHTVTDEDGNDILGRSYMDQVWLSGNFIELAPGKTRLFVRHIAHEGEGGVKITVDFVPMYMWNVDLDETDWG